MQFRGSMSKSNSFSAWMEEKQRLTDGDEDKEGDGEQLSYFGRLFSIQEELACQIEGLSGSLPDAGPMSAAFRARIKNAVYLFLGAAFFAVMAVLVGIPTILLKPSKFVTCVSLTTLCTIGAIAIMQKPSVFVQNMFNKGLMNTLPLVCLLISLFGTIYIVVFKRSYIMTMLALVIQTLSMLWFVASFIPGGNKGLKVMLQMSYLLIKTALTPMIFVCRKTVETFLSRIMS